MCGIVGIISNSSRNHIEAANNMIQHRGPNDRGIYNGKTFSIAHQRLSILDLSPNGKQPMVSSDGNFIIVFNGEIYNHLEIRKQLKGNYSFKSSSDTETILYAYIEYGNKLFKILNGIFAFTIYNKLTHQIVICRDPYGVKPLYFYQKENEFFFASEIKSFLKIPDWDKSIDYTALVNYIHFLYSPSEQTPFKYVKKMLPGHYAVIDLNNVKNINFHKYYDIPFDNKIDDLSELEWIEKIDIAFSSAVERQLLSDVPIGFFLSGGLDSSLIVAKAKEISGKRLQCYTIDTDISTKDRTGFTNDLFYAKKVAKHLDVDLQIVQGKIDIVQDFDKMIWHLDEPQADAAPLNVLNICREARENGSIVMLGGAGGDDLFSGYRRHRAIGFEKYIHKIPHFLRKGIKSTVSSFSSTNPMYRRARKLTKDFDKDTIERIAGYYEWLPLQENKALFHKDIKSQIKDYYPSSILIDSLANIPLEESLLNKSLYWDMKYFLTDHNLNYTDKMSMAVGVEARVPFLDLELVNLSTQIPINLKMKGTEAKYILKKVAEKYLPKEVIYRPKTGFGAPVRKWITEDMDEIIEEYLSYSQIKERGIFNYSAVQKLINDNKTGKIDASYSIWALLSIESWMRQYVDVYHND